MNKIKRVLGSIATVIVAGSAVVPVVACTDAEIQAFSDAVKKYLDELSKNEAANVSITTDGIKGLPEPAPGTKWQFQINGGEFLSDEPDKFALGDKVKIVAVDEEDETIRYDFLEKTVKNPVKLDSNIKKTLEQIIVFPNGTTDNAPTIEHANLEFSVDGSEYKSSLANEAPLEPGTEVKVRLTPEANYEFDTVTKSDVEATITVIDNVITITDDFLEAFNSIYVDLSDKNEPIKNIPHTPDHTDWMYDSGLPYYDQDGYHYGIVDTTMLSSDHPLKMKLVPQEGYQLSKPVERTDIMVTNKVVVPPTLVNKLKDTTVITNKGVVNLPQNPKNTHWEYKVDDGVYRETRPASFTAGQKIAFKLVANPNYFLSEPVERTGVVVQKDLKEIIVTDDFLQAFNDFYVDLSNANLYANLPSRPDPDHTDWLYDSGVPYYDQDGYHYGEVDATMLSPDRPLKMKLVASDGYHLSQPVERTDIEVKEKDDTPVPTGQYFSDPELVKRLGQGEPVTQEEMTKFFDEIRVGDVITGVDQDGVNLPLKPWADLNAPQLDYVPDHIYAPFIDGGSTDESTKHFGDVDGLKYATLAFIQQTPGEEHVDGTISGIKAVDSSVSAEFDQFRQMITNINKLREKGGDVIMSFGGLAGTPIWEKINDPVLLASYFINLAQAGKFHQFDYDIEGNAQATAGTKDKEIALKRLAIATRLAQDYLKSKDFTLDISLTLPVLPEGLVDDGKTSIQIFWNAGVALKTVNIMNFDYGSNPTEQADVINFAKTAIDNTANQVKEITGLNTDESYQLIGSTHMPPEDDSGMPLSAESAKAIYDYVVEKNLSMLSIWSLLRDATMNNYDFTKPGGYFEGYSKGQTEQATTVFNPNIDLYSTGDYKIKESAVDTKVSFDPADIPDYSAANTYKPGDVVKTTEGYFIAVFDPSKSKPTANLVEFASDMPWASMGSIQWYENYYNTFSKPAEKPVTPTTDNYYYFLRRNGKDFDDPNGNSGSDADNSVITKFWQENAWDWKEGMTARAGMLFKYDGEIWYAKEWQQKAKAPSAGDSKWAVWDPTNKAQAVTNYWSYF